MREKQPKVVDLKDFAKRLKEACDQQPAIPAKGAGQQTYIAEKLGVSQEAVRKWFAGATQPRAAVSQKLARLLNVKHSWLLLGTAHGEINTEIATARAHQASVYATMALILARDRDATFDTDVVGADIFMIDHGKRLYISTCVADIVKDDTRKTVYTATMNNTVLKNTTIIATVPVPTKTYSTVCDYIEIPNVLWATHRSDFTHLESTVTIEHNKKKNVYTVGGIEVERFLNE